MSVEATDQVEKVPAADQVRTAFKDYAERWAAYWKAAFAEAWRTVFPRREDH